MIFVFFFSCPGVPGRRDDGPTVLHVSASHGDCGVGGGGDAGSLTPTCLATRKLVLRLGRVVWKYTLRVRQVASETTTVEKVFRTFLRLNKCGGRRAGCEGARALELIHAELSSKACP